MVIFGPCVGAGGTPGAPVASLIAGLGGDGVIGQSSWTGQGPFAGDTVPEAGHVGKDGENGVDGDDGSLPSAGVSMAVGPPSFAAIGTDGSDGSDGHGGGGGGGAGGRGVCVKGGGRP